MVLKTAVFFFFTWRAITVCHSRYLVTIRIRIIIHREKDTGYIIKDTLSMHGGSRGNNFAAFALPEYSCLNPRAHIRFLSSCMSPVAMDPAFSSSLGAYLHTCDKSTYKHVELPKWEPSPPWLKVKEFEVAQSCWQLWLHAMT